MKIASILFLTTTLLFCNMGKTGMLISYLMNQEYIAQVLCENKENVKLQCNGKCQLKKQLESAEEKNTTTPAISLEKLPEIFWNLSSVAPKKENTLASFKVKNTYTVKNYKELNLTEKIFHPPLAS